MARINKPFLFIILLLLFLPIILFASKKSQDIRSRAAQSSSQTDVLDNSSTPDLPDEPGNSYTDSQLNNSQVQSQEASLPQNTVAGVSQQAGATATPALSKEVYGFLFHPFVTNTTDIYLQYPYLSTLAYMGVSINKDGTIDKNNEPWRTWTSQAMHTIATHAHQSGTKVHLTIVLFNSSKCPTCISQLLSTSQNRQRAIASIMDALKNSPNPVDGANINFEVPPSSSRAQFTDFIKTLDTQMKAYNSHWTLVIDTFPSSTTGGGFDLKALSPYVDGFFIESYTLRSYKATDFAGSFNTSAALTRVANNYLAQVPGNKIILGFPLYTYGWKTADSSFKSQRKGGTGIVLYKDVVKDTKTYQVNYDSTQPTAWYAYPVCKNGVTSWQEIYYDNEQAFAAKFNLANTKNLGGVGFWAFSEDQGSLDVWNAIYDSFADKSRLGRPVKKSGFVSPQPTTASTCTGAAEDSPTPTRTPKLSATPTPRPTSQPSPTPDPNSNASINLSVGLDGIGQFGNKTPKKTNIDITVNIFAPDQRKIQTLTQTLSYNGSLRRYTGSANINIPNNDLYNIYLSSNGYLNTSVDTNLTKGTSTTLPLINLSGGDINNDNVRNLLDWNLLNVCSVFDKSRNTQLCPGGSAFQANADMDSSGVVDQDDITLWLQEYRNATQ